MAPLIPFVKIPELPIPYAAEALSHLPLVGKLVDPGHPLTIKPFGALVAFGVYIGSVVAMRHGRQRGIDDRRLGEFIFSVVGLGFVGGHMLDAVFYHPGELAQDPLYLFMLWKGLSSYGGFVGAVFGALWWKCVTVTWRAVDVTLSGRAITLFSVPATVTVTWRHGERVLAMCEVINSAFPLAWVFGRMGCASVHDHPGQLSDTWFAVRWPLGNGVAGRFDLGLMEMVLTIPLALAFLWLWKKKPARPLGFYTGWMCVAYAPVRFGLDFLRVTEGESGVGGGGDPRYGGLTPAQWACFGLLALGIHFLRVARRGDLGDQSGPTATETDGGEEARGAAPESESQEAPKGGR